jgi:hypothetical protein
MRFSPYLLAAVLAVTAAGPAFAEARQDFDLTNKTGYEISEVYVAPSAIDDWQNDVLGTGTLPDGTNAHIHFSNAPANVCKFDLKVVYKDDGSKAVWQGIDLCEVGKITIHYNRSTDTTSATFD